MTDDERGMNEAKTILVQAVLLCLTALGIGVLLAWALVMSPGCAFPPVEETIVSDATETQPPSAPLPEPSPASSPAPAPTPYHYAAAPTPYSAAWARALDCWSTSGPEPVVRVVPCDQTDRSGLRGFACPESPTGYCYGTIRGGEVLVCGDLAGVPHEFSHAAHLWVAGTWGEDRPSGSRAAHCFGVLR